MSSTTTKEKIMTKTLVGERIKLVRSSDPYTRIRKGDLGTVTREPYDTAGAMCIGVDWDNGSSLSLVEGEDSWVSVGIAEEWLTAFDQYLSAGYKLLDLWQALDLRDSPFLNSINAIEFPFQMSFDEYLAEMASIKQHLDEAGDK